MAALPYTPATRPCNDRPQRPGAPPCSTDRHGVHRHWGRFPCDADADYTVPGGMAIHRGRYEICGACHNDVDAQPWLQRAHQDVYERHNPANNPFTPPDVWPWPAGTSGTWTGFLTRLCKYCTEVEQTKLLARLTRPNRGVLRRPDDDDEMRDYPRNTCKCWRFIGTPGPMPVGVTGWGLGAQLTRIPERICTRHRQGKLNEMIAKRDANDEWLRTLARDSNGNLCHASGHRIRSRASGKSRAYRACRCGGDPDTPVNPYRPPPAPAGGAEVWQCMCCEGIIHLVDPNAPTSTYRGDGGDARFSRAFLLGRSAHRTRTRGDMSLGRHRADYTA